MTNMLFYGDNLDILRHKVRDETIDLCYIDPPFNSKRNYFQIYNNVGKDDAAQAQAFIDTWTWNELAIAGYGEIITNHEGRYTRQTIELLKGLKAVLGEGALLGYLVSMTQRVNEIQRALKSTGSFYLHCDPTASHYLKLVLDSVFCARGGDYVNEITWKRTSAHANVGKRYATVQDRLLFYTKSNGWYWKQPYSVYSDKYIKSHYGQVEKGSGKRFTTRDLTASMQRASKGQLYDWKGIRPPSTRCWAYSQENMERFEQEGRITYSDRGMPRLKLYLEDMPGTPLDDIWNDVSPINSQAAERLGYPTQKPEALLERIIQASSNEGDTVLDAYCGCGTTVAVAQRLRRQWIGIDITYQSIAVILKRLEDSFGAAVLESLVLDGIPRDMESARALANKKDDRVRKEFEKWALLTYSRNRATINEKKGADKGVDGTAYFVTGHDATDRVIFQVKSGKVQRSDIATLNSDRQRENAALAMFITLEESTKPMRDEALAAGVYHHALLSRDYPRIQIVTVQEILEGKRIDLPLSLDVLKSAAEASTTDQQKLVLE